MAVNYDYIQIYITGNDLDKKLPQQRIIDSLKALPTPSEVRAILTSDNQFVIEEELDEPYKGFKDVPKEEIISFFSNPKLDKGINILNIIYPKEKPNEFDVWLNTDTASIRSEIENIMDNDDLIKRAEETGIIDFRYMARIRQQADHEEKIDRRLFDYAKILIDILVPKGKEKEYALFLEVASEDYQVWDYPIMPVKEFIENLEEMVKKYSN